MIDKLYYSDAPCISFAQTQATRELTGYLSEKEINGEEILDVFKNLIVVSGKNYMDLVGFLFEMHINLQVTKFRQETKLIRDITLESDAETPHFYFRQNKFPNMNIRAFSTENRLPYTEYDRIVYANKGRCLPIVIEGTTVQRNRVLKKHSVEQKYLNQRLFPLSLLFDTDEFGYILTIFSSSLWKNQQVKDDIAQRGLHVATVPGDRKHFLDWVRCVHELFQLPYER